MKKKFLNWYLLGTFLIAASIASYSFLNFSKSTGDVGDIHFDKKIDDINFKMCDSARVLQYYNSKTQYVGGARAIKNEILPQVDTNNIRFENKSGIITFRFIVNCKGETGRFRIFQVDENQKESNFSSENILALKKLIQKLSKWELQTYQHKTFDSYYIVRCIVNNGFITDIF